MSREVDDVAIVAHELQAPVAAIRAAARTLAGADLADAALRGRLLQVILDGADELGHLVDDLLTAARLDAGAVGIVLERCDAVEIAAQAIAVAGQASEARRQPQLAAGPGPVYVLADRRRLRQVATNLLTNALGHGRGIVTVAVEAVGDRVQISVADEGPGIPDADCERVFDRYARLPGGSVRGTGLGLAIARELTETMGGTILAERGRARGARLVVELPAASDPG
ncbi:MAG: HAMP domain-containing sensor histidine kinase [Gaiellales bacterium]